MSFTLATDGARLHYELVGRPGADAILMIQGLGADKTGWALQRLAFAPSFRTIALDNRGSGRSDKPAGPYTLDQMADDAISVLDAAGVRQAHVMGASMGGAIAQVLAIRYPERVRSLVLACTACRNHPWRHELLSEWSAVATVDGMGTLARHAARWVIGPRSLRRISPMFGWLGPMAMSQPSHAFVAQVDAILGAAESDAAERLAELRMPTLIVVGNQDILTPRGDSEDLAERIAGAELVVISGAAHGLMVEHWRPFNRVVGDFWRQVARGTAPPVAA